MCDNSNPEWVLKESMRLTELQNYDLLDREFEIQSQKITELTSWICQTPICMITLVDKDKVIFKSKIGHQRKDITRKISFCNWTIEQDTIFEIPDTMKDDRFRENPVFLTDSPIRYYLGMPIRTPGGYNVGVLCVLDFKPRILSDDQKNSLMILSGQVVIQFELIKQNKELRNAIVMTNNLAKTKNDFLNNVSHELRTPLNAIYGYAGVLERTRLNQEQKESVNIIKGSVDTLTVIINDLLDFSKIEAGKLAIFKEPFDFKITMNYIHSLFKNKAEEKGISLNINLDNNIPDILHGDGGRIQQILVNLVGNSLKFTEKGEININIELIESIEETIKIQFTVKDTGIGISKSNLMKIFERFEQAASNTSKKYGGTGLGLSISKSLVEMQNGKLEVKSEIGQGSEFFFSICFRKLSEKEIQDYLLLKSGNKQIISLRSLNILVCEDNAINGKLIKKIFENTKVKIQLVENGKIGVELLKTNIFDLILMDLHMPVLNGFESTEIIRKELKLNTPIIAMTANAIELEKMNCIKIGMNDYLTKPFKREDLFQRIYDLTKESKIQEFENNDIKLLRVKFPKPTIFDKKKKILKKIMNKNCSLFKKKLIIDINKTLSPLTKKIDKEKDDNLIKKTINNILTKGIMCDHEIKIYEKIIKKNEEHINLSLINEMTDNDLAAVHQLTQVFLDTIPHDMEILQSDIEYGNFQAIQNSAHKLKSSVMTFGLSGLREKLQIIEDITKFGGEIDIVKKLFMEVYENLQFNFLEMKMLLE